MNSNVDQTLRDVLDNVLGLGLARRDALCRETGLFGAIPELDSMAVATLFGAIEDRFALLLEDDEIDTDVIATYGALLDFVQGKLSA